MYYFIQSFGFEPPKPLAGAIEQRNRKHTVWSNNVSNFTNAWVRKSPNNGETSVKLKLNSF